MRSSIVLGSLCAALAMASPINKAVHKKDYVYDITTEIVYVTVTAGAIPTTPVVPVVTIHTTVTAGDSKTHKAHSHSKASSTYVAPPPKTTSIPPPPPPPPTTSSTPAPAPTTEVAPVIVQSSPVAKATSTTAQAAAVAAPSDYKSTAIYHHAMHRANHSAPALTWDDTLAKYALATANTCVFAHDMTEGGGGYGQNLAAYGTTGDIASLDPATLVADAITNQWYYGEASNVPYGNDSPAVENVPEFLHFTAMVWKASTKVGCATVTCGPGKIFPYHTLYTVCDYSTEGNVLGAFARNVLKPVGTAPISAHIQ